MAGAKAGSNVICTLSCLNTRRNERSTKVLSLRTKVARTKNRSQQITYATNSEEVPFKVRAAQALIDVVPGEAGLRLLSSAFPEKIRTTFAGLMSSYKTQMLIALGDEALASKATTFIFKDMVKAYAGQLLGNPYEFPSYHRAIRSPYDYFQMANMYIGSLIDFDRSILRNPERWSEIQSQLDDGQNVILLANHQSEGDAAFIPLLTEVSHPGLGQRVTYVAGDRVVTDLLAKPFSMGKDLLCVHSKKHMNDVPEDKAKKMKQNLSTIKEMQRLLNRGGMLIWIAPAGGRDRRKADGTLAPDRFDPQAIDMMRKLGTKASAAKTHFYPLAMATYDIMPPPATSEKSIGEERVVNYTGVGLSLGEAIDVSSNGPWNQSTNESTDEATALANFVLAKVTEEYNLIKDCNIPGGGANPLPENSIRPPRAPSVPVFSG